ncbi:MAG TPA: hypothetical protein VFQ65_11805, partial [Kofleriaceae bacterium]|nr:hypothetical protein [Kofleriaceae bacterium]
MPASRKNIDDFPHIMRSTSGTRGKRYGGSSMMNGSRFALRGLTVFDITHAATSDVTTLNAYMATMSRPCVAREPGINAA